MRVSRGRERQWGRGVEADRRVAGGSRGWEEPGSREGETSG